MALFDMTASTNVRKLMVLNPEYPKDLTVKAGADAVFSTVIEKDGRPTEYTYKWYVNDIPVDNVNTAVYTRNTDSDNGVYTVYCEITNKAGVVKTRTAKMTVNTLPKLDSTKLANATVNVYASKTFEVAISEHGYPRTYTYQWYKNGTKISGATSPSYTFTPTATGTTTLYCTVTNDAGTVTSRTATITANQVFLYDRGDTCGAGWALRRSAYDGVDFTTNNGDGFMVMTRKGSSEGQATTEYINLSKYKTLKGSFYRTCGGDVRFGVLTDAYTQAAYSAHVSIPINSGYVFYSVDISGISGGYVGFDNSNKGERGIIAVSQIWLE